MGSSDVTRNRAYWDGASEGYQQRHAERITHADTHWGMWQLPDAELGVLGDVAGLDVLELGCGAGQFGLTLANNGARVTGLDVSEKQLEGARANGITFPLVLGSADATPFPDESFDLVVADHGANRFVDPYDFVPEVARLLRPAGLFVFSGSSPLEILFWDDAADTITIELQRDYFCSHRTEVVDGPIEFDLGYGDWIRLFRANGFTIEDLVEIRPPAGAQSSYRDEAATAWARRWPMEQIWKVRKA